MGVETTSYERQGFYSLKQLDDVATLKLGKNFLSDAIDQVVPYSQLEEEAHKIARDFSKRSIRSLEGIKRLINYTMKDIQDYLDFESFEVLRTINV